jgi:flavin reductase (DIM6/NTAB) family NADH-FMN oxidoreductase RutF
MTGVDPDRFRDLCGHFATGVSVVTARLADGSPVGMTVSSFASVSLQPPMISINVDHGTDMHRALAATSRFAVNILDRSQEALSRRFAEPHPARFDGVAFRLTESGHLVLDDVLASLECEIVQRTPAGDHTILVAMLTGGASHPGRPLLYYRGEYFGAGLP